MGEWEDGGEEEQEEQGEAGDKTIPASVSDLFKGNITDSTGSNTGKQL